MPSAEQVLGICSPLAGGKEMDGYAFTPFRYDQMKLDPELVIADVFQAKKSPIPQWN